ncbi:MAG: nitroreductase family protein [Pseudorhodoplanes sp.]|nr:FMN reductase [NAD(P)H] [Pseudorhodoplanes sp.]MBW7949010.1 nitroreductase family protein [Pseudorhodoplanes sp.]MCL4711526.1 nitroreductase family protein [Pseudorhodoplanes sp.]GIK81194.1 MAG: hypothetical protein BroJett024_22990 [Alphaproteobacteria bacterium]
MDQRTLLANVIRERFGENVPLPPSLRGLDALAVLAMRGATRAFRVEPVDPGLIGLLCAVALSSPTKSDLQQRDIVIVRDPAQRARLDALMPTQDWLPEAPALLVFCGNNRRQRQIHAWRGKAFANDHLDAFFNAAVDAAIALSAFVSAAALAGLGTCPLSAIRNRAAQVSDALKLPQHVFPVAGLAVGWPIQPATVSHRLPLAATVHTDAFDETKIEEQVSVYDRRRAASQPYAEQRFAADFGLCPDYGWSEDKARQYAKPERADFGAFIRAKGFSLE